MGDIVLWKAARAKAIKIVDSKAFPRNAGEKFGYDKRVSVMTDYFFGTPLDQIATKHKISVPTIYNWRRFYDVVAYKQRIPSKKVKAATEYAAIHPEIPLTLVAAEYGTYVAAMHTAAAFLGIKFGRKEGLAGRSLDKAKLHRTIRAAKLRLQGHTLEAIAAKMGVTRQRVHQILRECPLCGLSGDSEIKKNRQPVSTPEE